MSEKEIQPYFAEMGFTQYELLKGLPNAVVPYEIQKQSENKFHLVSGSKIAVLSLGIERSRNIASITLPIVDVKIEFKNFSNDDATAFLDRFRKYLHRGGG